MKISGAQAVIESLIKEEVKVIFGYPGGANMPIYDALYDKKGKIHHILVRHEQGAIHAAEGYARVTGNVGVCFATSGPGATNLVTGIADAMMDSVPLVCITGQVAANLVGSDAFQETDVIGITTPITKWNYQITQASEIPEIFAKAFYIASHGRPGPVVIDITKNAQFETLDFLYSKKIFIEKLEKINHYDDNALKKSAEIINKAKQPLVIAGHGVIISQAQKQLLDFVEKANLPTTSTLHGISSIPTTHPLFVGMIGMHGSYPVNKLINDADVIIAIGMRFDDRVTGKLQEFAPKSQIIHIDIDPAEHGKNIKPKISLIGDAKKILEDLLPLINKNDHSNWLNKFKIFEKEEKNILDSYHKKHNGITMSEVIEFLSKKTKGQAIIVADVGQNQMYAAKYYQYQNFNSYITSGGLGTMGFALPAAIGVKIGKPKNEVIAICGDGGFQMTIQELGTIMQEKIPIKILILNNNFLGMVRQWQDLFFEKRYSFTYMENPDFLKIAQGYNIKAKKVNQKKQLENTIEEFIKEKNSMILEVVVEKETNIFPMVPAGAANYQVRLS
ncbi:MAG: biosynthetic-type acetolactate synthase large subunit [Candidatus Microgenomates bacterium]